MAKFLKLSQIKAPALYIRQSVDPVHVMDLRDVLKSNPKMSYPFFTPIMVRKLAKPEKVKMTLANKAGTAEYELIRGMNRCAALAAEEWTEVQVDIVDVGDAEAFALQYDEPEIGTHKKHDLADRNFYIRTLRDNFSWKLADIGAKMKLTEASVSRILADKQATGKTKTRKKRKKKTTDPTVTGAESHSAASGNGGSPADGFVPAEFFALLGALTTAYSAHKDEVMGFMDKADPGILAGAQQMIAEMLGDV